MLSCFLSGQLSDFLASDQEFNAVIQHVAVVGVGVRLAEFEGHELHDVGVLDIDSRQQGVEECVHILEGLL